MTINLNNQYLNYFCQAEPQLQVKHTLKAELALISVNSAPHPGQNPHLGKFSFQVTQ